MPPAELELPTGLGKPDDAKLMAKREEEIDKMLTIAYSADREAEINRLLPAPLRGWRAGVETLYEKAKKGGPLPGKPKPPDGHDVQPGNFHLASVRGRLAHIGKAMKSAANPGEERKAIAAQVRAEREKQKAAQAAAEEAAKMAAWKAKQAAQKNAEAAAEAERQEALRLAREALAFKAEDVNRMQKLFEMTDAPLEAQLDFAIKYANPAAQAVSKEGEDGGADEGGATALRKAMPVWEEAMYAVDKHQQAVRKGVGGADLEAAKERCVKAASVLTGQEGDTAEYLINLARKEAAS